MNDECIDAPTWISASQNNPLSRHLVGSPWSNVLGVRSCAHSFRIAEEGLWIPSEPPRGSPSRVGQFEEAHLVPTELSWPHEKQHFGIFLPSLQQHLPLPWVGIWCLIPLGGVVRIQLWSSGPPWGHRSHPCSRQVLPPVGWPIMKLQVPMGGAANGKGTQCPGEPHILGLHIHVTHTEVIPPLCSGCYKLRAVESSREMSSLHDRDKFPGWAMKGASQVQSC